MVFILGWNRFNYVWKWHLTKLLHPKSGCPEGLYLRVWASKWCIDALLAKTMAWNRGLLTVLSSCLIRASNSISPTLNLLLDSPSESTPPPPWLACSNVCLLTSSDINWMLSRPSGITRTCRKWSQRSEYLPLTLNHKYHLKAQNNPRLHHIINWKIRISSSEEILFFSKNCFTNTLHYKY